jgi:hypothetical protein
VKSHQVATQLHLPLVHLLKVSARSHLNARFFRLITTTTESFRFMAYLPSATALNLSHAPDKFKIFRKVFLSSTTIPILPDCGPHLLLAPHTKTCPHCTETCPKFFPFLEGWGEEGRRIVIFLRFSLVEFWFLTISPRSEAPSGMD